MREREMQRKWGDRQIMRRGGNMGENEFRRKTMRDQE